MNNDIFDLSRMGYRELAEASELLKAYTEARPEAWDDSGVKLAYNSYSGVVFLTNDISQELRLRDGNAEMYYWLSYAGEEGHIDELYESFKNGGIDPEDYEQLANYLEGEGMSKEADEVRKAMECDYE